MSTYSEWVGEWGRVGWGIGLVKWVPILSEWWVGQGGVGDWVGKMSTYSEWVVSGVKDWVAKWVSMQYVSILMKLW